MTFVTKPNLDSRQFKQVSGTTLTLEGETDFIGVLKSKGVEIDADISNAVSGFTLTFIGDKIVLKETPNSDADFDSDRPTTRSGIPSVNVGGDTVTEFLEEYFFPSVPPSASISSSTSVKQFGDDSSETLSWSVTRNTQLITSITIDNNGDGTYNITITPTGESQSGTENAQFTSSEYSPSLGTTQTSLTYRIRVEDEINDVDTNTTSITWRHKRYWFKDSTFYTSSDASTIESIMNSSSNNEFTTNKSKTLNNYSFTNEYFYYAYPKHFGVPTFTVNGLVNNAWGNASNNTLFEISFTNSDGYIEDFYVAKSDSSLSGSYNISIS